MHRICDQPVCDINLCLRSLSAKVTYCEAPLLWSVATYYAAFVRTLERTESSQ